MSLSKLVQATLLLLSTTWLLLPSALLAQQQPTAAPKKKAPTPVQTVRGRFIGFQMGDYLHAGIRGSNGEERWFYADDAPCLNYFLPAHAEHDVDLSYRSVTVFIPEAGGREKIDKARDAQAGGEQCSTWWRKLQATMTPEQIQKRYQPLFEKSMRQ